MSYLAVRWMDFHGMLVCFDMSFYVNVKGNLKMKLCWLRLLFLMNQLTLEQLV